MRVAVVGTGLAYVCWFTGLRAMPAGAVSLIGLGTVDERMLILVDIDRLMSSAEMGLVDKLAA